MFTSVTPSSLYTSTGSAPPPGCVAISISDSTSTSSTSSSWQPPEGTPKYVTDAMEDPDIIREVTDPVGHRDYMRFIIFKEEDNLFLPDEYEKLRAKKIEMVKQQEIINGSSRFSGPKCLSRFSSPTCLSRFNSPKCLKLHILVVIIFGVAFIALFSLTENLLLKDKEAFLPSVILSSGKCISLCGTLGGIVKAKQQTVRKVEASTKLETVTAEIDMIVEDKKAWFEAKARRCLIDHVERTPCYGNSKMLNRLMVRGILSQENRIIALAKNLLMQKTIDIYWETSHGFLKLKLLEIMPNEFRVNCILRPLVDAVLLIKYENSTDPVRSGLDGLRESADSNLGNIMENYLNKARDFQNKTFENRLNPPATDLYGAYLAPSRGGKPKREGPERKANTSNITQVGIRDNATSTANSSLSSSRTSTSTTPLSRASTSTTPSASTTPPKKASTSSSVSPTPSSRASINKTPSKKTK